jgi:hypothetical protein
MFGNLWRNPGAVQTVINAGGGAEAAKRTGVVDGVNNTVNAVNTVTEAMPVTNNNIPTPATTAEAAVETFNPINWALDQSGERETVDAVYEGLNPGNWMEAAANTVLPPDAMEASRRDNQWQPNAPWNPNFKHGYEGYNPDKTAQVMSRSLKGSTGGGGMPVGGTNALMPLQTFNQGVAKPRNNQLEDDMRALKEAVIGGA